MSCKCVKVGVVEHRSHYEDQVIQMDDMRWHVICDSCGKHGDLQYNAVLMYKQAREDGWCYLQLPYEFYDRDAKVRDFCDECSKKMTLQNLENYRVSR
jgi:hypothetical protein